MKCLGNLIDGRFVLPRKAVERVVSEDPGDLDRPLGEVFFSEEAAAPAVSAAKSAFKKWSALDPQRRWGTFSRFRAALEKNSKTLAFLITREMGKTLKESEAEVARILAKIDIVRQYESVLIEPVRHEMSAGIMAGLRFRPRGVIVVLSPFNVPAYLALAPALSALASGNTVVLKPSEVTPFTGQFIAELSRKAGFPRGVFNLVQGGAGVGSALVGHPGVDGVIFTGSWKTGALIRQMALKDPHKVCALEMGGKNAALILSDCDLENAVDETFHGAFATTGQRCNATSRILVEKGIAKKFIALFLDKVDAAAVGYGAASGVFMGPLASKKGFERTLSFIRKAPSEGFDVLRKGGSFGYPKRGYYVRPSVHLRQGAPAFPVKENSYTDEEVFGPDAAIYVVKNLEEALAVNNRSLYGLATSVFTRSKKNFEKILKNAESGLVHWNVSTTNSSARLPFGGLKRSGNHRPAGFFTPLVCTIPTASLEREV